VPVLFRYIKVALVVNVFPVPIPDVFMAPWKFLNIFRDCTSAGTWVAFNSRDLDVVPIVVIKLTYTI
jgi:hypothetical protein